MKQNNFPRSRFAGRLVALLLMVAMLAATFSVSTFAAGTQSASEPTSNDWALWWVIVVIVAFVALLIVLFTVGRDLANRDFAKKEPAPLEKAVEPKKHFELPFHIVKRSSIALWKKILIYAVALIGGLLLSAVICTIFSKAGRNPFDFFRQLTNGAFGTERKTWLLLLETALLMGTSIALIPAFKMKFWNLGGNGQILMGCLCSYSLAFWLGGKMPNWLLLIFMFVTSVAAGILWALIPAIFRAIFGTNETLFTLMMNYIAVGIVLYFRASWVKSGSGQFPTLKFGILPALDKYKAILTVVVFFVLTILMFIYLRYSKHGYEISVVGESVNTAKYVGIDVKRVVIRTMILSGAIAGLVGFFLIARTGAGLSDDTANNMGFTAIMTSWLGGFNPLLMFLTCFFIAFITKGMTQVRTEFKFTNNSVANFVIGLIYFCVISCAFFINYKIVFRSKVRGEKKASDKKLADPAKEGK